MGVKIFYIEDQANGNFNNGEIIEKKPIGFSHDGGKLKPYSNLFYWAHAWTPNKKALLVFILIKVLRFAASFWKEI